MWFEGRPTVYGDSAYGSGEFQQLLRDASINSRCRTQSPAGLGGLYSKDRFSVDLNAGTVTCPAGVRVQIRRGSDGDDTARFASACTQCDQRQLCTTAKSGRTIRVGKHEAVRRFCELAGIGGAASALLVDVVEEAVSHSPDYDLLFRGDS